MLNEIIYDIDKTKEMNYSMVPIGAEIVTEAEILTPRGREVIEATNDPNTIPPKPPKLSSRVIRLYCRFYEDENNR